MKVSEFKSRVILIYLVGIYLVGIYLIGLSVFPVLSDAQESLKTPRSKVILQLRWHHQFQFAGFYAAKEKKYYHREGLDVEIKPGGFGANTVEDVVSGSAEFGVTDSEVLFYRLKDNKPVVVLAPIFQHSPLAFMARKETSIIHPKDFIGKRLKISQNIRDLELHATLLNEGVGFDQFKRAEGPVTPEDLFDDSIDALSVYVTNEPYYYNEKGIDYTIIYPLAYGVDFYGDTLFTTENYIEKFPHRVKAFRQASIKGWEYAMANKEEIIHLIHQKYNPDRTLAHLRYEADSMDKLILPDLVAIGQNNPGRWKHIAETFVRQGIIEKDYSLEGFLYEPSEGRELFWTQVAIACLSGGIFLFLMITIALYVFNNRLNREIKAREKSQKALVLSEARLKAMFENIYSGVALYSVSEDGEDFIIKSFNKAAQRIENVSLDDVLGKPVREVLPEMRGSGLIDVMERVHTSGLAEHLPTRNYENKRITAWRENYVYKLPSGEVAVVCNDETVRKKAEINRKHLDTINHIIIHTRHTKDILQNLLDAMLDIFECDRVWLLHPCNPKAESFTINVESSRPGHKGLGVSDKKIKLNPELAQSMEKVLASDRPVVYEQEAMNLMYGSMADKYGIKSEIRMAIYPKIDQAWMLGIHRCESSAPWTSEDQVLFNAIGRRVSDGLNSILLIDELTAANQTLRESEDRFEKIFHSSPVGLVIATRDDLCVLDVNQSCMKITGFREKDILGKNILQADLLFAPESLPAIDTLQKSVTISHMDIRFFNRQGEIRDGYLSSQEVSITGKKCIVVAIEDVTGYKKAQKEKQTAQQHAAEQEKYALIGQVAGKMAHDFNNILGAIMGNTELSLLECEEEETRQTFELILEQTKRGRNLTRNLVAFAKDQEPRQDYFDLNEKIDLVLNLLKKDLEEIRVSKYFGEHMPELLADSGMIENALVNIIHNSIHAMSKTRNPQLIIHTSHDEEDILIEVVDNGCGIPPEHQNSIYTPAFTLKNSKDVMGVYDKSVKGTGYGLFNVKKIVEKHKGRIWFETQVNEGTRFSLSLPVIKRDLTKEEKIEVKKSTLVKKKKILIVEDEQSISDVQSMILIGEPFFHDVDVAQNGHMALDFLKNESYDLISLDYLLPGGLNGMDLYNEIRKTNTQVPILFISGNIDFLESIITLTQKDSYLAHLSKPCQNRDYVDCINRLLEHAVD